MHTTESGNTMSAYGGAPLTSLTAEAPGEFVITRDDAYADTSPARTDETVPPPARAEAREADAPREELKRRISAGAKMLARLRAEQNRAIVLDQPGVRRFIVGMVEPDSIDMTDDVARALRTSTQAITFERLEPEEFDALFALAYNGDAEDATEAQVAESERAAARMTSSWAEMDRAQPTRPIIRDDERLIELFEAQSRWAWDDRDIPPSTREFTCRVLLEAFIAGASDIHVESSRDGGRIRFRCDSIMYARWTDINEDRARKLVNSLADMSGVKPERLKFEPYDSSIKIKVHRKDGTVVETEYRITFTPAKPWPEVVMRLNVDYISKLEMIGFLPAQLDDVYKGLAMSEGLVLVTGPTGSGKSNTLQSIYSYYEESDSLKIVEFADPIEFMSPRRTQIQITDTCTWEQALRSSLRLDPNIISPGECRDATAASAVMNASLTGHIVPTTFHTNDVASTFTRLKKLGIASNLQADAINLVISQRLLRLLCKECRRVDEAQSAMFNATIYKPGACVHCYGKGYKGQTAVAEVLLIRPEIREWISLNEEGLMIVKKAIERKWMMPMQDAAREKMLRGDTTLMEIERVMKLNNTPNNQESPSRRNADAFVAAEVGEHDTGESVLAL
jgi:type II secretory ATPase GspE/PulE/Tfp pilus assembly ATPase PilB-like protein